VKCKTPPLWSSGQSSWLQNGDVLCFLWGTNWIYICYVEESRPPLWNSGQSSWLQIGDVLCFLWGTNWMYICFIEKKVDRLCCLVVRVPGYITGMFCFLWGTNWIYVCYVKESRPPLSSSGQSSRLQIQKSGFDSRRYQIFWEVVGLERGPLSLVSTIKICLEEKVVHIYIYIYCPIIAAFIIVVDLRRVTRCYIPEDSAIQLMI
jgi:hypothetical protein